MALWISLLLVFFWASFTEAQTTTKIVTPEQLTALIEKAQKQHDILERWHNKHRVRDTEVKGFRQKKPLNTVEGFIKELEEGIKK